MGSIGQHWSHHACGICLLWPSLTAWFLSSVTMSNPDQRSTDYDPLCQSDITPQDPASSNHPPVPEAEIHEVPVSSPNGGDGTDVVVLAGSTPRIKFYDHINGQEAFLYIKALDITVGTLIYQLARTCGTGLILVDLAKPDLSEYLVDSDTAFLAIVEEHGGLEHVDLVMNTDRELFILLQTLKVPQGPHKPAPPKPPYPPARPDPRPGR